MGETTGTVALSKTEMALENEQLRLALQAAQVGTWDYNMETGQAQWSTICKRLFGLPEDASVTSPVYLFWLIFFIGQCLFYAAAYLGYRLEHRQIRVKALFVPFYFTFMNVCAILGFLRYWRGNTSGIWEKARRADEVELKVS